jgi:glycosyltransferase involved in cell wall biosynthesis
MRVAIVGSRGFPSTYSGYETLVRYLAPYLRDRGHSVTVYGRHRGRGYHVYCVDGIRVVGTPVVESKSLSTPSAVAGALHHALRGDYAAVLAVNLVSAPALVVLQHRGTPVLLNTDGLEWRRGKWGVLGKLVFFACAVLAARRVDHLISDSRGIQDYYSRRFGVRSHYIPYGAELRTVTAENRILDQGIQPNGYFLVVARLIPENSIDLILDAYEYASVNTPLVIAGDANYQSDLGDRLRRAVDHGGVHWLGHVSDQELLEQLWAHCRLYLHGHSVGGTNPSLLQALGLGAPTLAFDTPFNREVLQPHTASLFSSSPIDLGRRMRAVVNGTLEPISGQEARDLVRDRYCWPRVLAEYEGLLAEIATEA